jgi:hypothetical protein
MFKQAARGDVRVHDSLLIAKNEYQPLQRVKNVACGFLRAVNQRTISPFRFGWTAKAVQQQAG